MRNAGTFTPGLTKSVLQPFVHTSSTFTFGTDVFKVDDVSISVNNNLKKDRFYNCDTRIDLPPGDQDIQLTCTFPFDSPTRDVALLNLGANSITAQVVYTAMGGALSLTFDFEALHAPIPSPQTPSGENDVQLDGIVWTARYVRDPATGDLVEPVKITLDDVA